MINVVRHASDDLERDGVVDVLVFFVAGVGDADQLALRVEQPAARIAAVDGGVDAHGAVGAGGAVYVQADVFAGDGDDAFGDGDALPFRVADGDRRFADAVTVRKGDFADVETDGGDVCRLCADEGDVFGERSADVFALDGIVAVVVRRVIAVGARALELVFAAVEIAVDAAGDILAVCVAGGIIRVGFAAVNDVVVGDEVDVVFVYLIDDARTRIDGGAVRARGPVARKRPARFVKLGIELDGGEQHLPDHRGVVRADGEVFLQKFVVGELVSVQRFIILVQLLRGRGNFLHGRNALGAAVRIGDDDLRARIDDVRHIRVALVRAGTPRKEEKAGEQHGKNGCPYQPLCGCFLHDCLPRAHRRRSFLRALLYIAK